jgi:lipid-A-disaccharide synthase
MDHLLTLLPFEPAFFEKFGLESTFVGHPAVERTQGAGAGAQFRSRHNIDEDKTVLGVLPGSRSVEIRYLLPLFKETVARLSKQDQKLHTVIPTVSHVAERVREVAQDWPTPITLIEGDEEKFNSFDAMEVALAASGTVSTELALASVPTIIAYKVGPITGFIFERLVNVPHATLISIVLGREIFPEFIQGECTSENLTKELNLLINNDRAKDKQRKDMSHALKLMGQGATSPSARAASAIVDVIEKWGKKEGAGT